MSPVPAPSSPTVGDVVTLSLRVCLERYGESSELNRLEHCGALLRELFGPLPAASFGPVALRRVQGAMVECGLGRREVNRRIQNCRRLFSIAVSHELVRVEVLMALKTLEPLRRGKTLAHENAPMLPVPAADVAALLPHVSPTIASMVRFQHGTGARTGEVCKLRVDSIDRTHVPWVCFLDEHKTRHHDHERRIHLGPQMRALLSPLLADLKPTDYLFSPIRAEAARRAEQRAKRKSRVPPSQRERRKDGARAGPGEHYQVSSYAQAVVRGCERAGLSRFRTYRLRHSFLTRVRDEHGVEVAAAAAGHAGLQAIAIYTRAATERAARLAEQCG